MNNTKLKERLRKAFGVNRQHDVLNDIIDLIEKLEGKNTSTLPDGKKQWRFHDKTKCGKWTRIAHADSCHCED